MKTMTKALLLIEFQQEWLDPTGKLYSRIDDVKRLEASQHNAEKALAYARKAGHLIVHSGLSFKNYQLLGDAELGLRAHIPHHKTFLANTMGSQFHPKFTPQNDELEVSGRLGASAFSGSNLDALLRNNHVTELTLMGYALHVCIESTLRAAHDLGYTTRVITDACAAFTEAQETYFKDHIVDHFGQAISTQQFITGETHE